MEELCEICVQLLVSIARRAAALARRHLRIRRFLRFLFRLAFFAMHASSKYILIYDWKGWFYFRNGLSLREKWNNEMREYREIIWIPRWWRRKNRIDLLFPMADKVDLRRVVSRMSSLSGRSSWSPRGLESCWALGENSRELLGLSELAQNIEWL